MAKTGKRVTALRERVDPDRIYEPTEAVALVKETATAKFDETVELHLNTGLDGRHADQQIRGTVVMPHGLGRSMRVAVFAEGEAVALAIEAGADEVGGDDLVERVEGGELDFDVVLAQRELMGKVGKLGRVLGPRGLMPNPRANTVLETSDIARGVKEAKAGRVEFRLDRTNLMHCSIGKASFSEEKLVENLTSLIAEIAKAKPSGSKGQYIRSATLSSTMGASITVDTASLMSLASES
ncbi:MAG TPA: 50S ribosomal protein L1 [Dehalococcoidia bacterium]|nr:50S ribosomal protein L1 [Dehalococcoidia bacterium]